MSVTVAKTAGFCFGVNRAVETVIKELENGEKLYTLGEIIHNPQVIEELRQKGADAIHSLDEAVENRKIIIRSHGVPKSVYDEMEKRGISYIDATCPYVKKIQNIVSEQSADCGILIAGDVEHPEVKGIIGHCKTDFLAFKNAAELQNLENDIVKLSKNDWIMVAQTTFNANEWKKCVDLVKKLYTNAKIFDTICKATLMRQTEAADLAAESELMIVIGGKNSSNTGKLAEICSRSCQTLWIETADELKDFSFNSPARVGVTAGASTPAGIIKEVHKTMCEIEKNLDEMTFEEMLNASFKSTYTGEKVKGIVTSIADNEISVDIGTKHTCYAPLSELTSNPNLKPSDLVKVGDELEFIVLRVNDVEGTVLLSKKRLDAKAGLEKVMKAAGTGEVFTGVVTDVVRGGVLVITEGVKVFIPASLTGVAKNESLEQLLKQEVKFVIREVNDKRQRAVGSIKDVLKEARKAQEEEFWSKIEVGQTFTGSVKSLTSYGAFVDLGGVDGMVHISELSWQRIKHPSDVVKVGDTLEVFVKELDTENKKISLGYKKAENNPWEILKNDYAVNSVCKAKIVSMTTFGAFAQIIPGVDGLIHISQISNERIAKPQDVLSVGQEVDVMITDIDFDKKRISLSMKALLEETAEEEVSDAE